MGSCSDSSSSLAVSHSMISCRESCSFPLLSEKASSRTRMLWDLRLISLQQRFMSPGWCKPPPFSLLHSVPSSCPSPSTVDWHGTQWHPGHEGRPAASGEDVIDVAAGSKPPWNRANVSAPALRQWRGRRGRPDYNYLLSMPMWFLTKEKKEELCKQRDAKLTELNTLKKKSPADLWKEDLAAFSEELESSEAKEKENAAAPVKKGAGKGKSVKVKQETLPTPQGRRVIPRVTSTMKAEANKKADLKKGEGKRGKNVKSEDVVMKMEFDDAEGALSSEDVGLAARLSKKTKTQAKERAKTGKQSTLQFKPVAKRLNKSSGSEDESDQSGSEEEEEEVVAPRERVGRRAKDAVKYSMSDSEEEFGVFEKKNTVKRKAVISDDDSFIPQPADSDADSPAPFSKVPEPAKKVTKSKSTVKPTQSKSSSPSDDQLTASKAPVKPRSKVAAAKKAPAAKKPAAAAKAKAAGAKQPSIMSAFPKPKAPSVTTAPSFDSSDSEAGAKVTAKKAKAVPKRKVADSDDSDSESDNLMSRLKARAAGSKKPKKCVADETFNVSDQEAPVALAARSNPSRARKPVVYNLDSDSDEDF